MGKPKKAAGPIGFMPSDGKYLGSRDLRGIPAAKDGTRMPIRVVEVVEYPPGEVICGKAQDKAFLAMIFERPPHVWLAAPVGEKPKAGPWEPSRKQWKLGPEVIDRLALRLGDDTLKWPGAIVPLRLEVTSFGHKAVYGVRPTPFPWEDDPQRRRQAMDEIVAGTYQAPGLPRPVAKPAEPAPERQPGEDDEPIPSDDPTEPPADWQPGDTP